MSRLTFKAKWHAAKGRILKCYAKLLGKTDLFKRGCDEVLLGKMQSRLAQSKPVSHRISRTCSALTASKS